MTRALPVVLLVGCVAVATAGAERPSLDRVLIAADDIGGGWNTVGEAPTDPSQDPDLVRWGVREQGALHYTRERNGVVQVCSIEIWAFEDVSRARVAHQHFTYLTGLTQEFYPVLGGMFATAQEMAQREGVGDTGYRLIVNQGDHAGQQVTHLHLHLLAGKPLGTMG